MQMECFSEVTRLSQSLPLVFLLYYFNPFSLHFLYSSPVTRASNRCLSCELKQFFLVPSFIHLLLLLLLLSFVIL